MTSESLHPDALLERELHGELSPQEAKVLSEHLKACSACRLEQSLRHSENQPISSSDSLMLAGLAEAALTRARVAPRRRTALPQRLMIYAAASLLLMGGGLVAWAAISPKQPEAPASQASSDEAGSGTRAGKPSKANAAAALVVAPVPSENAALTEGQAATPAPTAAPAPTEASLELPRSAPDSVAPTLESAGALFAAANAARSSGNVAAAAEQYRKLQSSFPRSSEALLSYVSLGRLLLDRQHQPSAALAQFQHYLAAAPGGALREEALIGRALSLQQLGRGADEQSAWRALLAAFPDSMYAKTAKTRLDAGQH